MSAQKLLIAVPTFETIDPACFKAIYGQQQIQGVDYMFDYVRGYDCARARNMIIKEAMEFRMNYVLMVDSDTIIPPHAIRHLYQCLQDNPSAMAAMGWQLRKRTKTGQTETFALRGGQDYNDEANMSADEFEKLSSPFEIKGGGFGCALIRIDESFKEKYETDPQFFKYITYPDGSVLSEDNYFCSNARADGKKIFCCPLVKCGHINKITF